MNPVAPQFAQVFFDLACNFVVLKKVFVFEILFAFKIQDQLAEPVLLFSKS